jgi:hypothetical protein
VDGKWAKQATVAAQTVRINELLHATDVSVQRKANACLGTADNLLIDAVRLVLTGDHETAREYFGAVRELTLAAISAGETWVFTDRFFARCEALRLRAIASWALGSEEARVDVSSALEEWEILVGAEDVINPSGRNAHTIAALLAAHRGDYARSSALLASIKKCDQRAPWCRLAILIQRLSSKSATPMAWDEFFAASVISSAMDKLVAPEFNVGEACLIAHIRSMVHGWDIEPFEVIELLRG